MRQRDWGFFLHEAIKVSCRCPSNPGNQAQGTDNERDLKNSEWTSNDAYSSVLENMAQKNASPPQLS